MAILDDLLNHEHAFTRDALKFIPDERPLVEELLALIFATMNIAQPFEHRAVASLSRLFTDSCGALEQTFVSTLRAQPRLGWASLRFAAESLKDMDCIVRQPDLEAKWFAVLKPDPDAHEAALAKFKAARRKLAESEVTRACSLTMKLANVFGAHPNAGSHALLGVAHSREPGVLTLPLRATSPDVIRWHIRSQLLHGYHVAVSLADFRVAHLSGDFRDILAERRGLFDRHMVPFVRTHVPRPENQE